MKIVINFASLEKEYAYYLIGSVKNGTAEIVLDLGSLLELSSKDKDKNFKKIFSKYVLHEILHVIEDLFDKSFNHKRINNALRKIIYEKENSR